MQNTGYEQSDRERPTSALSTLRDVVQRAPIKRVRDIPLLKRAAVSAIFFERDDENLEVLFIQRASHPVDPWSGHMAFPGGRVEDYDTGTRGAAERETNEEIDFDLTRDAEWVGRMSDVRAHAKGKVLPLVITPHVYRARRKPPLTLNYEVADALWVPFDYLLDRTNREEMAYEIAGFTRKLPCYRYNGKVIWGLTLRMLDELLENWPELA